MTRHLSGLWKQYRSEVEQDIVHQLRPQLDIIREEDIARLPAPVQRHFRLCGFMGRKRAANALIRWDKVQLKTSEKARPMKVRCFQYNAVPEPTRIVYMASRICGLFPFEGRDSFSSGHGNMLIRLLRFLTVTDARGIDMDKAALTTLLAEVFLLPAYALQPYITWESIDDRQAAATLTWQAVQASGIFHFNDGRCVKFHAHERYNSGAHAGMPWSACYGRYNTFHAMSFPSEMSAVWHYPDHDLTYFTGEVAGIDFDVKHCLS